MKRKILALLVSIVLLAVLIAGCGSSSEEATKDVETEKTTEKSEDTSDQKDTAKDSEEDEIVIGLTLMDFNFTFFQDMLAMAKKTAEEQGVKLVEFDGRGNPQKQLKDVEDMITALKVDAIFLNPVDSEAIVPAVLDANDAGIPVVSVDVRSSKGKVEAHIASDNVEIGRTAARYAVELLKEKHGSAKGTVIMVGYPQITSIRDRMTGFEEVITQNKDIEFIKRDPISLNVESALALAEDILTSYPKGKVDIIFGGNSTNALGILSAVESAGRNEIDVIGVDEDKDLLAALERKSPFAATVVQYPTEMGRLGVEYCAKLARGESIEESEVRTAIELVTRDTINDYMNTKKQIEEEIKAYK